MKRIIAIVIAALTMVYFCPQITYAAETVDRMDANALDAEIRKTVDEDADAVRINEYDAYLQTKSQMEENLVSQGASRSVAEKKVEDVLKNPAEIIYEFKDNWSDRDLRNRGYNAEQINIIRNFQGSPTEIRAVAATLSSSLIDVTTSKSGNTRKISANYYWYWNVAPLHCYTDAALMAASEGYLLTSSSTNKGTVTYSSTETGANNFVNHVTVGTYPSSFNCGYVSFSESITKPNTYGQDITYYALSGVIHASFQNTYGINQVSIGAYYLHTKASVSITTCLSISGPSISLSITTSRELLGHKTYGPHVIS